MKKKDLFWLLLSPAYLIIGIIRHEGCHALAAMVESLEVHKFVFWPSIGPGGNFYFGYVSWAGTASWMTIAAPYAGDLLTFAVGFALCAYAKIRRRWIWINILILTVLSPLINSAYNYFGGIRNGNDIGFLLQALNPIAIHAYFGLTLAVYAVGFWLCLRKRKTDPSLT
ncbi:MAG: hypothetical protein R6U57_08740 [Anaerolineales bacterium]